MNKVYGLLLLLLCPSLALAQNTGSLSGNVTDALGAFIPNATATLTSPTVGSKLTVRTNESGEYVFPVISIGVYTLTVHAPTFANYVQTNIEIDAAQNVRVDAKLQAASDTEQVTVVDSGSTAIDTQSGTVGTLIDRNLIDNLPIDGNNVVSLAALLPGVVDVNAPTTFTQPDSGPTFSANGSRANQNLLLLDGLMWNNVAFNTGLGFPPPPSLQEVSVLQNNYKAQYGRNVGSVFNVLTRSGTNQFHGTVWEYMQNRVFDAADYMTQINPKLVQNQFGATMGGPILKDKIHFFFSYQDLRAAQEATAQTQTLTPNESGFADTNGTPLPCSATGAFAGMAQCANFSADAGTTDVNLFLTNPMSRALAVSTTQLNAAWQQAGNTGTSPCVTLLNATLTQYGKYMPNSEIPSVCFNPISVSILKKYVPYPNLTGITGLTVVTTAPLPRNDQDILFRVDWILPRHTLDARYYYQNANDARSNAASGGTGIGNYEIDSNLAKLNFGSIGDTWIVRPTLLNVFRVGYKRYDYYVFPTDPTTAHDLGINLVVPGVPSLPTINVSNRFTLGSNSSAWTHTVSENIQIDDSISWTHGNHSVQAGASYFRLQYLSQNDSPASFIFYNQGYSYTAAEFLGGLLNSETVANRTNVAAISPSLYLYAQDDWRATSRLTLNYGLRYELPFMWKQPNQQAAMFIPGYQSTVFPGAPPDLAYVGDPGIKDSLVPSPKTGMAPRFGFAYDMFGNSRTIVKGGAGLFFDAINASVVGVATPFHYSATYSQPAGGFSQPLLGLPDIPSNFDPKNPQFVAPYNILYPDRNFTTPYTMAGNLGITQRIGNGYIGIDYLLKLGRHQLIPVDQNPSIYDCNGAYFEANPTLYCTGASTTNNNYASRVRFPGFNYGGQGVVDLLTEGTSNYNALQIIGGRRGRGWLSIQGSYTYSKSLDESSNGQSVNAHVPNVLASLRSEYGPSTFDAKHMFSMGWVVRMPKIQRGNVIVRKVANNWQFTGSYSARTGHPFSTITSSDVALTKESSQRAFLVPGVNPNLPSNRHRADKIKEWFNTAAFSGGGTKGSFSTQSRDSLVGPAYIMINFGIGRGFAIPYRKANLQFRADAFNVFNTPNLNIPNTTYSSAGQFGEVLSTTGGNGAVQTNGRRMQLSLVLRY